MIGRILKALGLCWHDWKDLGTFQYVSLFTRSSDVRVYRCNKCGGERVER